MRPILLILTLLAASPTFDVLGQVPENEKIIGAGARARPAYDGADRLRGDVIPYLRLYGEHFFARTTQGMLEGGWRAQPIGVWVFGLQAAYEAGRVTDESAFLKSLNFENLGPGASIGLHAEGDWKIGPMPLNALLRYRQHVDADQGTQADLRMTAGIFSHSGVSAAVFGQLTWADSKSMHGYFGITPQQSPATGLPAYDAGSGIRTLQLGLLGSVELSEHWLMPWGFTFQVLEGDAADSPLVRDRTNVFVNAGIAYRF
jgi:MipA family protein